MRIILRVISTLSIDDRFPTVFGLAQQSQKVVLSRDQHHFHLKVCTRVGRVAEGRRRLVGVAARPEWHPDQQTTYIVTVFVFGSRYNIVRQQTDGKPIILRFIEYTYAPEHKLYGPP